MSHSRHAISVLMVGAIALISSSAPCSTNVLLDNFNDGNFAGWTVNKGTWSVVNSTLVGHGAGADVDGWIYTGNTNWSDFIYEADAVFQSGNAEFVFRSTGHWTNEYRFVLWSQTVGTYSNRFALWEYNNTAVTVHTLAFTNSYGNVDGNVMSPVPITDVAHVKIEAIGSLLSFYVNDGLIYQFNDPTPLQNGRIGLGTIWNWTDGFDNVSVTLVPEANVTWTLVAAGFLILAARRAREGRRPEAVSILPSGLLRSDKSGVSTAVPSSRSS